MFDELNNNMNYVFSNKYIYIYIHTDIFFKGIEGPGGLEKMREACSFHAVPA